MKTEKIFLSRLRLVVSAIFMLTLITILNTKPAAAQIDPGHRVTVVGITQGQTARINVLNTADLSSPFPPGPCRVELSFQFTSGKPVLNRDGRPYDVILWLDRNHGAFL